MVPLFIALTDLRNDCLCSVAKGGELCLTSGDRREPEDSDVYIKPLPPRSAKPNEEGEGEEEDAIFLGFPTVTRG